MLFEICAANIQSALAAQKAGAQRIELCSALDVGGLTPSAGLIYAAVSALQIPVNVLIRPREGNFCYTRTELGLMFDDIAFCQDAQAAGVVIGALTDKSFFDLPAMQAMVESADGLDITCHRAFDYVKDPFAALEALIDLGIKRVLTSGQAATAYEGRFLLQKLVEKADGRIQIMPGSGINSENIREIAAITGAEEFHFSGRRKIIQANAGVEIPGLEGSFWASEENTIRKVMNLG